MAAKSPRFGKGFRLARAADAPAMAALELACFDGDCIGEAEFLRLLADPAAWVILFSDRHGPAGHLVLQRRDGEGYIFSLAVAPRARGAGVAGRLLNAALDTCRRHDLERVTLEVRAANAAALSAYGRLGFRATHVVDDWYSDGEGAIVMDFRLSERGSRRRVAPRCESDIVEIVVGGDPDMSPSDAGSIASLRAALDRAGLDTRLTDVEQVITAPLASAGFLRTFTTPGGPAHLAAMRYELAGRPVLDTPSAIVRGCDKVYQAMLFAGAGIATPATRLVAAPGHVKSAVAALGSWPIVVKDPQGAFCNGLCIANTLADLETAVADQLARSGAAVLQAFAPSAFDWRIGVLDGEPLFAAQYWMAPNSWKIRQSVGGEDIWGDAVPVPVAAAPDAVLAAALRAAKVMGSGLWGVDLKVIGDSPIVIEVNDNPNIDNDVEAAVPEDRVWDRLAGWYSASLARTRTPGMRSGALLKSA